METTCIVYLAEQSYENIMQLICQLVCENVSLDVMEFHVRNNLSYGLRILLTPPAFHLTSKDEFQRFFGISLDTDLRLTFHETPHYSPRTEVKAADFFIENYDVQCQVKIFHWNLVTSAVY